MSQSQNNNRPSRNNAPSGHNPSNMARAAYDGYGPGFNAAYYAPNPNMGYYNPQNYGNMYGYNPYGGYTGYEAGVISQSAVAPPSVVSSLNDAASKKTEQADAVKDEKSNEVGPAVDEVSSGTSDETFTSSMSTSADIAAIEAAAAAAAAAAASIVANSPPPVSPPSVPAAPPAPQQSSNPKLNSFIGKTMDLISKVKIRYMGTLCNIDTVNSTVALQNVRAYGTESRVKPGEGTIYAASDDMFEYLVFNSRDIESLYMREDPVPTIAATEPPVDPAIVSSGKRVSDAASASSTSVPGTETSSEFDFEAANQKFAALQVSGKEVVQVDKAYDKEKSFFDDLSIERNERGTRGVNLETFGSAALPGNGRRGGRAGHRGGHRGGYNNNNNEYSGGARRSQYNTPSSWRARDEYGNEVRKPNHQRGGRGGKGPQKPRTPYFTNKFDD